MEPPLKFVIKSDCRQEVEAAPASNNHFLPSLVNVMHLQC